jgi:hypothetical protein
LLNRPEWIAVRGFWFDPRVERLGEIYGFGHDTFNGGLFLINRRHHYAVLRLAEAIQPAENTFPGLINPDEIALGSALTTIGIPTLYLDRRFNWIQYGRGDLAGRADVVVAHACRPDLRRAYADGTAFAGPRACGTDDGEVLPEFSDAVYIYERVGYDLRPLSFRRDGTIGYGGGDAERFHFGIPRNGAEELVLGSVFDETCTLIRDPDGGWRGRWSHHEQMPVALTRHRAQVLIDLLTRTGRRSESLQGVEVGVDRGESSAVLLRGLDRLHLYMVDLWRDSGCSEVPVSSSHQAEMCYPPIEHAARATAFARGRRTLVPCDSVAAARHIPDGMDLVFIDGDHTAQGVLRDLNAWWPKVTPEGLCTGHDYGHPDYPGVKQAVDAFAEQHNLTVCTASDMVWYYEPKT